MRIMPKDLGLRWHVRFVQARDSGSRAGTEPPEPRLGLLGRVLTQGTGLDEQSAAAVVPAASTAIGTSIAMIAAPSIPLMVISTAVLFGALHLSPLLIPAYLAAGALGAGSGMAAVARAKIRRLLRTPIAAEEVDRLLERSQDAMDRRFLELVRDAVRQPGTDAAAENVRTALGALAEAIERLPPIESEMLDTVALREEAAQLQHQARFETDQVTAESLERRARAMLYRAQTHEQSALMVQRSEALRSEIEAQIDAMREGLVALQTHSVEAVGFGALAVSAQEVATEAIRMAAAREELDTAVGQGAALTPASAPPEAPALQAITTGGTRRDAPATDAPAGGE